MAIMPARDISVELPPADASMEAWPGPGHGEHCGDEAGGADPPHWALRGQTD